MSFSLLLFAVRVLLLNWGMLMLFEFLFWFIVLIVLLFLLLDAVRVLVLLVDCCPIIVLIVLVLLQGVCWWNGGALVLLEFVVCLCCCLLFLLSALVFLIALLNVVCFCYTLSCCCFVEWEFAVDRFYSSSRNASSKRSRCFWGVGGFQFHVNFFRRGWKNPPTQKKQKWGCLVSFLP